MEADYLTSGWELAEKHADADLFVVRGCSVTARAQHDCEKLIDHLKRHYPTVPIKVCGCLKPPASVLQRPDIPPPETPSVPLRTARTYLKVQDGCAGQCTFCIVPRFRGPSKSEPFDEVLDRARRFIDAGYREIVVTGCNLSHFASQGKRLPDLVAALAGLEPSCRIRVGSLEPGPCALETIPAMAEHANVCRFLHIPIQSGSDHILLAMKRPYRMNDVEELIDLSVKRMPGLGLGCDLMTGFPGESEARFKELLADLKRMQFDHLGAFAYSPEEGTKGAKMRGRCTAEVARERERLVMAQQERIWKLKAKRMLGQTFVALVVAPGVARMASQAPDVDGVTYVDCDEVGEFVNVRLEKVKGFDFVGVVV